MFSIAVHALTNRRRRFHPHKFESQLFLYVNQNVWGIENIKIIVHNNGKDTTREATPDI